MSAPPGTKTAGHVLAVSLALGLLGNALLRATPWGIGTLVWSVAFVGAMLSVLRREGRAPTPRAAFGGVLILGTSALVAWRDSTALLVFDIGALAMGYALTGWWARGARSDADGLRAYVTAVVRWLRAAAAGGVGPVRDLHRHAVGARWVLGARAALRTATIAGSVALIFGCLLVAADPVFAALVNAVLMRAPEYAVVHTMWIVTIAWITGGWLNEVVRAGSKVEMPAPRAPAWGVFEAAATVAVVDALLAAFVVVQLHYLFGGADLVRVVPGLTRAEYARQGVTQLCAVAGLAVSLVLAANDAGSNVGGSESSTLGLFARSSLSVVLIGLVLVILASAWQRLRLYSAAFGLTEFRVYAAAVIIWIAIILVWCVATIFRGRRGEFAIGALTAAYAILAALHALNPAAYVARVNVDTWPERGLDVGYLRSLSADATPVVIRALPRMDWHSRCLVAITLEERWRRYLSSDWRSWNWSRRTALSALSAQGDDFVMRGCRRT